MALKRLLLATLVCCLVAWTVSGEEIERQLDFPPDGDSGSSGTDTNTGGSGSNDWSPVSPPSRRPSDVQPFGIISRIVDFFRELFTGGPSVSPTGDPGEQTFMRRLGKQVDKFLDRILKLFGLRTDRVNDADNELLIKRLMQRPDAAKKWDP